MRIILASKSPRRREILATVGLDFEIITSEADESCDESDPEKIAEEIDRSPRQTARILKDGREKLNKHLS